MHHNSAGTSTSIPPSTDYGVIARRRRFLMAGFSGAALTTLAACGGTSSQPPGDRLAKVDDVPQPYAGTTPQSEAPDDWTTVTYEGQSFSLPTAFEEPAQHDDWGIYKMAYDRFEDDTKVHRILVTGIDTEVTTANGIRQTVNLMNGGLIENYSEINTISWSVDDTTAIERIAFYWGPDIDFPGYTWMIASSAGVGVVTSLGVNADDGLRNSIEDTLTLDGGE